MEKVLALDLVQVALELLIPAIVHLISTKFNLFHPVSNFNTLRHQFESGKTQKTAGRRLSVTSGNTKVTIAITIIQV
jgi:hypothetical protein